MKIKYSSKVIENSFKKIGYEYKIMTNGEIAINSPFVSDTTFDCRISVEKQCFHDFESDESGNIEKLFASILGVSERDARDFLIKNSDGSFELYTPKIDNSNSYLKKIDLPTNCLEFKEEYNNSYNYRKALLFLNKKLVTRKLINKYKLLWTDNNSYLNVNNKIINFNNRIIIPSFENDSLVYFQSRDYLGKSQLRYKNPPKVVQQKKIVLPFYDLLKENSFIFLSEGPWEAIQYSGTYMIGPVISNEQVVKIKEKNPKEIYIIPDNDETGRLKLAKNIKILKNHLICKIYVVKWWVDEYSNFKDPIDAGLNIDTLINVSDIIIADKYIDLKVGLGVL